MALAQQVGIELVFLDLGTPDDAERGAVEVRAARRPEPLRQLLRPQRQGELEAGDQKE